jgi:hypothetical protein
MHNGWDRSQAKLRTTRSLAWLDPHDAHTRALVIHTQVYHACHGVNILHSRHGTALLSRGGCHTRWHSLANCNHRDSIASRTCSAPAPAFRRIATTCAHGSNHTGRQAGRQAQWAGPCAVRSGLCGPHRQMCPPLRAAGGGPRLSSSLSPSRRGRGRPPVSAAAQQLC